MHLASTTILSTVFIIMTVLLSVLLSSYSRKKAKSVVGGIRTEQKNIDDQIHLLNVALHDCIEKLEHMVSLDEYHIVAKGIEDNQTHLEAETKKRESLDTELENVQKDIAEREKQYSALKQGNQNAASEKDELMAKAEAVQAEIQRLENKLNESREQLANLEGEAKLTDEQKAAMQEVTQALDNVSKQVKELSDANEQSSKRYKSLQTQYDELEKEYRRLIEAELNAAA